MLKAATAHGLGAREGAAFVTEELGLEQVFRYGCGIDGNEGPGGALRMLVQCARHQLFAGAGLTGDHDRDLALAEPANGTKHVLHGGRLAQHFRRVGKPFLRDLFALAFFDSAANQLDSLGQVKGLGQVFKSAALKGRDGAVQVRECRHDDDRQAR